MKNRLISISDIVFTAVIVAAAFLLWFFPVSAPAGETVVFRRDGQVVAEAALSEDGQITIEGEYTNVFEIKNGRVLVIDTDCPNRQCEKTGAISSAGASIVCAPNHTSATVEGGEADVDAVTG